MSDYKVYWIHRKIHDDILTQGYVGITRETVETRYRRHVSNAKRQSPVNPHFYHSLMKYDDIVVTTLCLCERNYALILENKLRPVKNIGWNIAVGGITNPYFSAPRKKYVKKGRPDISGEKHPNWQGGIKNFRNFYCLLSDSPVAKAEKLEKAKVVVEKTRQMSDEQKKSLSDAKKRFFSEKGVWANSQADKFTWRMADKLYNSWVECPCGDRALSRRFGMFRKSTVKNMIKMFKNGWIPFEDKRWLEFKNES